MKPIYGSKTNSKNIIILVEGTKIIQEEGELATTFNESFVRKKILELMKIL